MQRDGAQVDVPADVTIQDDELQQNQPRDRVLLYVTFARYRLFFHGRCIMELKPINESRVVLANPLNTSRV